MQFHLEDMTCGGCARTVTKTIQMIDPNAKIVTDPPTRRVEVQTSASQEQIAAALSEAGFRRARSNTASWPACTQDGRCEHVRCAVPGAALSASQGRPTWPQGHRHHHQVLGQGHEAQRHVAVPAHAGALEFPAIDIDRLENRHGPDGPDEQRQRNRHPHPHARDHLDACDGLRERVEIGIPNPALGQQVVAKPSTSLSFCSARRHMAKATNHSAA